MRPRLLDLFSGAGGAAMGYHRAGFDVTGVNIKPQKNYPFDFVQGDALEYVAEYGREFDVIHASPPCQAHVKGLAAVNRMLGRELRHTDLVGATREALRTIGRPYVIENVLNAPLDNPLRLCGSSFGLAVQRHRYFECSHFFLAPPCEHYRQQEAKYWTGWVKDGQRMKAKVVQVYGNGGDRHQWPEAMGIDWMRPEELCESIPPAYTEYIGEQLLWHLEAA